VVRVPGQARGFSAKIDLTASGWEWAVWRHARTEDEKKAGFKHGVAKTKPEAAAKATAALNEMRARFGL